MKHFIALCSVFELFFGEIDAMFLQRNDSQVTLITEENELIETIELANNSLNLREISLFDDDIESIKACVERGDDVNMIKIGITPLLFAVANDYRENALFLVEHGADPNQETKYGCPLDLAMKKGAEGFAFLLSMKKVNPADIEKIESIDDTTTSTEFSLFDDDIESVKVCVERGDDINMVQLGTTPLANAVVNNSKENLLYLLKQGADPNQETKYGFPLDLAMRKRNKGLAQILIKNGANMFNVFNIIDVESHMSKL